MKYKYSIKTIKIPIKVYPDVKDAFNLCVSVFSDYMKENNYNGGFTLLKTVIDIKNYKFIFAFNK